MARSVKEGQRDTYHARRKGELRWAWNTHCDFHKGTRKQQDILRQVPLCGLGPLHLRRMLSEALVALPGALSNWSLSSLNAFSST